MLYTFTSYSTFYELYVGLLKAAIAAAVALSVLVSLDRLWKVLSYLHLCFKGWKHGWSPEKEFGFQPLPDPAKYSLVYPKVAVQLPMFNEKAVCQAIIDSACELAWPRERFCVQVSTQFLCMADQQSQGPEKQTSIPGLSASCQLSFCRTVFKFATALA